VDLADKFNPVSEPETAATRFLHSKKASSFWRGLFCILVAVDVNDCALVTAAHSEPAKKQFYPRRTRSYFIFAAFMLSFRGFEHAPERNH
jgi:hypothetical protein